MEWLNKRWSDPVWSKVIAWAICGIIAFVFLVGYSLITEKSFITVVIQLLSIKIALWIVLIVGLLIFILYTYFISKKSDNISPTSELKVLVDFNKIGEHDLEIERIKGTIEGKENGEPAQGSYIINDGLLNITRTNTQGRFLLRIIQYSIDNQKVRFIKNNIHLDTDRRLLVTFKGKIIGGSHSFRVICKKYHIDQWVDKANYKFIIQNEEYQSFSREIKVKANEDFRIQMDDTEVANPNSSIQIKDFKVIEIL